LDSVNPKSKIQNLKSQTARIRCHIFASGRRPALAPLGNIVTWRLPSGIPHIGIVTAGQFGFGQSKIQNPKSKIRKDPLPPLRVRQTPLSATS
jgi:uncharacterized protein YijF (DUF1287 family)